MPSKDSRLISVDVLRGVAALSVVVAHFFQTAMPDFFARTDSFWIALGQSGVGLFFLISGFCIHAPYVRHLNAGPSPKISWSGFFKRRFTRLYPIHFAVLLASAAIATFLPLNESLVSMLTKPTAVQWGLHLFMLHSLTPSSFYSVNSVLWTLGVEAHFYLMYPVFVALRERWSTGRIVAGACVVSVLLRLAYHHFDWDDSLVAQNFFLTRWWEWLLGCWICERVSPSRQMKMNAVVPTGILILAVGLGTLLFSLGHGVVLALIWPIIFAFVLSTVIQLPFTDNKVPTLLAGIGLSSYSLYLLHPIAFHLGLLWGRSLVTVAILDCLFAISMTTVFYLFVERRYAMKAKLQRVFVGENPAAPRVVLEAWPLSKN